MGLPSIEIIFKSLAATAMQRGERGTVALILKDTVPATNPIVLTDVKDIPVSLSVTNKEQIELAFMGGVKAPRKVIAYILATEATDYKAAQDYLETVKWDYLAIPEIKEEETTAMATWVKGLRDNLDLKVKAVLPKIATDHEGIINFTTDDIKVGEKTYTSAQYSSRIAGILAGNPLNMSSTYQVLSEVDDVPHLTKIELDTAIDAGRLVLMHDGEKVKIARAVNSLTTTTADKGEDFKKIKIVDSMDLASGDIKKTFADDYVGKYPNDYNHKCIFITAINGYLEELENEQLYNKGKSKVEIDIEAHKTYLKSKGIDITTMKEQEIKEADTGSSLMLTGRARPLDAMEDLKLNFYM